MELKQAGTRWDEENTIDRGGDIPELNFNLVKQCDTLKYPDLMSFYNTDQTRERRVYFQPSQWVCFRLTFTLDYTLCLLWVYSKLKSPVFNVNIIKYYLFNLEIAPK